MQAKRVEAAVGGRTFTLETGHVARQANTAVLARYADTVVLATLVVGDAPSPSDSPSRFRDFMPLTVEYREKMYAAGKVPGGFFKREGRPTTDETLTCRLIDRGIRALFPEGFLNEIQIFVTVLSFDGENPADIVGMNAAGACASLSGLPFHGPVASLRIGEVDGAFVLNPTYAQLEKSSLDMVVSLNPQGICMVEAAGNEVPEERLMRALDVALREGKALLDLQSNLIEQAALPKQDCALASFPPELLERIDRSYGAELREAFFLRVKSERNRRMEEIRKRMLRELSLDEADRQRPDGVPFEQVLRAEAKLEEKIFRQNALEGRRADGRGPAEIRPITILTGLLPRTHGSALFTRGETQALVTLTLGTKEDEQWIDSLHEYTKHFVLHYNFPSFSTGEIKPIRGPGRREIGHGMLAERALRCVLPEPERFPYTIRLVSEILESNGSSSMASVCGGTLALMDGGVPIRAPVAGVAMGLICEPDGRTAILSDILGTEDAYGDMDFKVAGTEKGITALQMDLKTPGIGPAILERALQQAREGRLHVLAEMRKALPAPRPDISPWAPRIVRVRVDPEKIGLIIGGGGRTVRELQRRTSTEIELDDEEGTATIVGRTWESVNECARYVRSIVEGLKVGEVLTARVVDLKDFGAFVEVVPTGEQGLIHISEVTDEYVDHIGKYLKVGQEVKVKVVSLDETGRIRMSLKEANRELGLPQAAAIHPAPTRDRDDRRSRLRRRRDDRGREPRRGGFRGGQRRGRSGFGGR